MDIYFYLAVAGIIIIISWRMVSGFRKGMVQEILSLIAMVVAGFCAYLLLGAIGSYLNREIGRLIQIIILLLIVCIVYKLANLIFTSISLVSRLPVIRSADKFAGSFEKPVSLLLPTASAYRYGLVTGDSIDVMELN